jgi:N-acyl homoserine lactone hydrolase
MKIHAIQTGSVAIKARQVEAVGHGARRQLNMLLDRQWIDPVPIFAFAIEHPEGVIVVDTGETARSAEAAYFPRWHPFFRYGVRTLIAPDEEIGPQLQRLGIAPGDVRTVVLTHLHTDHAGGLHHFPHSEILVSREDRSFASGLRGRVRGYPNNRWPSWFDPTVVDLAAVAHGPFPRSARLTQAGDVTIVALHGHTPGHMGVIVDEGEYVVLLAGDSSYTEDLMLRGIVDGPSTDEAATRLTHERIRAFAAQTPTVYLVAHDPDTPARLAERRVVEVVGSEATT